jgi:hypothetical protein
MDSEQQESPPKHSLYHAEKAYFEFGINGLRIEHEDEKNSRNPLFQNH